MSTGTKVRTGIAGFFVLAGVACLVAPSPRGTTATVLSWVIVGVLAVAFVLDMRELRADRRAEVELEQEAGEGSPETRIQILDGGENR